MAANKKRGNTASAVLKIADPIAKDLGLILWDIQFLKEGASWFLRIFIDKDEGVSIDDCEAMSRALDKPLDEADIIEQSYYLEVSSPGINRKLTRSEHFLSSLGKKIKIRTIRPIENKREFFGELKQYEDGKLIVELNDDESKATFNLDETAWVRLDDDFGGHD